MAESLIFLLAALVVLLFGRSRLKLSDGERAFRLRQQAKKDYAQGRLAPAAEAMAQAVEILKRAAGPDHQDTLEAQRILSRLRSEMSQGV